MHILYSVFVMSRKRRRGSPELSIFDGADAVEELLLECCKHINQQHNACWRETFFQKSLVFELQQRGYEVSSEVAYPVYYRSTTGKKTSVGNIFVDILTPTFCIETKMVKTLNLNHREQARLYSSILQLPVYLVNAHSEHVEKHVNYCDTEKSLEITQ